MGVLLVLSCQLIKTVDILYIDEFRVIRIILTRIIAKTSKLNLLC